MEAQVDSSSDKTKKKMAFNFTPESLKALGEQLGLSGQPLADYIARQQELDRAERQRDRDLKSQELEARQREVSLERRRMDIAQANPTQGVSTTSSRAEIGVPKIRLAAYKEGDDLGAYLTRFERVAAVSAWDDVGKALQLGSLLEGRALSIYSAMDESTITSYDNLKSALLRAFRLTDEHYRKEFRNSRVGPNGSFHQLATDLQVRFDNWLGSAKVERSFNALRDFVIQDQFFIAVPAEVRLFLKEQNLEQVGLEQLANLADNYARAHNLAGKSTSGKPGVNRQGKSTPKAPPDVKSNGKSDFSKIRCFSCGETGHKRPACPRNPRVDPPNKVHRVSHALDQQSTLAPMFPGTVNGSHVSTILRDTGCTCVVVSDQVLPHVDTSNSLTCEVADYLGRRDRFPIVRCYIKCELFEGWVEAVKAPIQYCAVLLGNIKGAKIPPLLSLEAEPPSPEPPIVQAVTRSAQRKALHPLVLPSIEPLKVSKGEFVALQQGCNTLADVREKLSRGETFLSRSKREYKFVCIKELLYRECVNSPVEGEAGKILLVVPYDCRELILKLAHDIPIAGHFAHRRTELKVCDKFWWPGVSADIVRYCRSCDVCQRTSARGRTRHVEMAQMPIISTPFERVAVDLVGPLKPASQAGHKYILTLIDYATNFIEAVPLKEITSISVAESLMTIFARVDVPRELISDRGTQFTSDLMGHVHKLVGIKPIFTTPYHPMMNGKLERQHAVLKSVLRKLCLEKPKDWDRYLIPTLFALREIPSDTTGFSPFELLYGRQVRGPLTILYDLWSEPALDVEVRTTYEYVIQLRDRLEQAAEQAASSATTKSNLYKRYFDKGCVKRTFIVGDEVLLLLPDDTSKLLLTWKGPYKVLEVKSKLNYVIDVNGNPKLFHVNLLKRYVRRATAGCMYHIDEESTLDYFGVCKGEEIAQTCVIQEDESLVITVPGESGPQTLDINPNLTRDENRAICSLLERYKKTLSDIPGCTNAIKHRIVLKTTEPVFRRSYPIPVHLKGLYDKEIDRMVQLDIIEPSTSDFCSPSIMVKKESDENKGPEEEEAYRVANDFRGLNAITEFDAEPMPSIEADLHKFAGGKFLTEVDITRAYYQIPLEENSRRYTAFPTSRGLMQYKRLPFGLSTACATYNRLMKKVMENLPGDYESHVSVYFDNIYIVTPTFELHLEVLELVFARLAEFGLTARPSKCHFAYPNVKYLGFRIGNGELAPASDNTETVKTMAVPRTKKQLRSFLGLVSFYRMFIPKLADLTSPLTDKLKKNSKDTLEWPQEHLARLEKLKGCLISPPVLKVPDLKRKFCLRADASNVGLGAVLLQYWENVPHPVFFASRKLLPRERNYSAIEKECLAIVWAVEKFRYYLYGQEFIIETDHRPLVYMRNFKGKNSRLVRWALSLQPFRFTIVHIPGAENHGPDLLSRCLELDPEESHCSLQGAQPLVNNSHEDPETIRIGKSN